MFNNTPAAVADFPNDVNIRLQRLKNLRDTARKNDDKVTFTRLADKTAGLEGAINRNADKIQDVMKNGMYHTGFAKIILAETANAEKEQDPATATGIKLYVGYLTDAVR